MGLGWRLGRQLHAMERLWLGERLRRLFRLQLVIQVVCGGTALKAHGWSQPPLMAKEWLQRCQRNKIGTNITQRA
jgi:hypothetical protein